MDDEFDALVAKGKKSEKEVEGMKQLANEIQYAIVTRKLRPGKHCFVTPTNVVGDAHLPSHANILQSNSIPASW
jgi:SPX domain protein involved in polyphosphate accumulation